MNKSKLKAIRSVSTIVLTLDGDTINIQKGQHPKEFEAIDALLQKEDLYQIEVQFANIKKRIERYTSGIMSVSNGALTLKGDSEKLPNAIAKKFSELEQEGEDFLPLLRFWRKLKQNPSENSKAQLYSFMIANKMSITELGDIVVEKGVARKHGGAPDELVDHHTGDVDHSVGMVVQMPREQVNDDPNQTCSSGLHCAPPEYVRGWYSDGVIVECILDPKDVVSVPHDYNQQKIRVCKYRVVGYAKATPRTDQIVSLGDFISEAPESIAESRSTKAPTGKSTAGTFSYPLPFKITGKTIETSDAVNEIKGKTANEIIDYVVEKTGVLIKIAVKNKAGVIKKAVEILDNFNKAQAEDMVKEVQSLEQIALEIDFKSLTAKEIIAFIQRNYEIDLSNISLKNKAKIVKEAEKIVRDNVAAEVILEDIKDEVGVVPEEPTNAQVQTESVESADSDFRSVSLRGKTKRELIKIASVKFNEKVGNMLTPYKTVRKATIKLFVDAGYFVEI